MTELLSQVIWALLGLFIGAGVSWLLMRSRQREALAAAVATASQASTMLHV